MTFIGSYISLGGGERKSYHQLRFIRFATRSRLPPNFYVLVDRRTPARYIFHGKIHWLISHRYLLRRMQNVESWGGGIRSNANALALLTVHVTVVQPHASRRAQVRVRKRV